MHGGKSQLTIAVEGTGLMFTRQRGTHIVSLLCQARKVRVSAGRTLETSRGDAITAVLLAAVERRVGKLHDPAGEMALAGRHKVEPADPETDRDGDFFTLDHEGLTCHPAPQFAGNSQCRFVASFRQHDNEFLAADTRNPIDSVPQDLLQARSELSQDLVTPRMTHCLVDLTEVVDVAQDERQSVPIPSRARHLAREVLAEEASARHVRQIVSGRQLAVLIDSDPKHAFQLGDASGVGEPCIELPRGYTVPDALICTSDEAGFPLGGLIELWG